MQARAPLIPAGTGVLAITDIIKIVIELLARDKLSVAPITLA
jgi:hypothetical protein